MNDVKM